MALQIAIITGEASGDRVGAQLIESIRDLRPDVTVWGTGGRFLRRAGVELLFDSSKWGAIGIAAAAKVLPRLLAARAVIRREILRRKPDIVILVDFGAFNLGFGPIVGMAPWLREHRPNLPIFYYFPPGSWRRTLRRSSLAAMSDRIATPFPWSETELNRLGANATFVGHPLLDLVKPATPPAELAAHYGLDLEQPIVGLLPGSRAHEIAEILPVQLEAAAMIHARVPGVQFLLGLAPTVDREDIVRAVEALRRKRAHPSDVFHRIEERLREELTGSRRLPSLVTSEGTLMPADEMARRQAEWLRRAQGNEPVARPAGPFPLVIVEDATYEMMAASDVLLTASGTATLEAAILGKPMVIVYRMSQANIVEYFFAKKSLPPHIGMPNLIAERRICPEYIQDDATPENLSREIIDLLLEPGRLLRMKEDLRAVVAHLGEPGGANRAARMVLELAERKSSAQSGESRV